MTSETFHPDPTGTTIAGRYWVQELLGRGGMAAVYRVRDLTTARPLALKRSYARTPAGLLKRRAALEREYHTLAQLAHPGIIEVFDFGIDERGPFYTMELLDGSDLHDRGRLPWREACAVLRDVASSLALLHARGLVHRDVSARNVRCTSDGRAKLIDFGAMTTLGVCSSVVGTPPFLAPEAFQMQSLDGRADLFALGALGYQVLTGRHAYPARSLSELRDVWRSVPAPVSRVAPDVPAALSALIGQLLALDRGVRPHGAAEVIASLCAIADLADDAQPAIQNAYLMAPQLVGRERALVEVRKRMLSLVRGDGASLLVEGVAGSGRSRVLDACALEGKLAAATVLRADARDAALFGAWGVTRALLRQLRELLPNEVAEALRLSRAAIAPAFLEAVAEDRESAALCALCRDRGLAIRELRDLLLAVSEARRLWVIVDDVERCDEPSAALLAALSHKTERHALLLTAAVESGREQLLSGALRLLRSTSQRLALDDLSAPHTEALLCSVFGDVKHVPSLAGRVHAVARGNPRATMELAQHLVDRKLAVYARGAWVLPAQLDESDLPDSLASSLRARLTQLGDDARELAGALAAADGDDLASADWVALSSHRDPRRTFAARGELVAARVWIAAEDGDLFSQRGFVAVLAQLTAPAELQRLHAGIADLLERRDGAALRRAHHLLAAGREREAITLLCTLDLLASMPKVALLERALEFAQAQGLPVAVLQRLRLALLFKAPFVLAFDSFRRVWPSAMTRLEHESGLACYAELHDLPEPERLSRALALTQARHAEALEHERAHDVFSALRELAVLHGISTSFGMAAIDREFLRALPDITPLLPLTATFEVVVMCYQAGVSWVCGRYQRVRALYADVIERIAQPDHAGLEPHVHARLESSLRFLTAQLDASAGAPIESRAQRLEREPAMRASAWQLRQVFSLSQGNLDDANRCMRRAELARLQEPHEQYLVGMTSTVELLAAATLGDARGVSAALETVAVLCEESPGWRPLLTLGQSRLRQLQGDARGALELLLPAFALAPAGEHLAYGMLASAHVDLLVDLNQLDAAIAHGSDYLAQCQRHELLTGALGVDTSLARALSRAGRQAEALVLIEARIAASAEAQLGGVGVGMLFEQRARIALALQDRAGFERCGQRCADEFGKGKNPALAARFARLLEEARGPQAEARRSLIPLLEQLTADSESEYATVHSRMRECSDEAERGRCALTLLLQNLESFAGYLYRVERSSAGCVLELLASVPEEQPETELGAWAGAWVAAELEVVSMTTETPATRDIPSTDEADRDEAMSRHHRDASGREFSAWTLFTDEARPRFAGLLLFEIVDRSRRVPDRRLASELAVQLLAYADD